jgi:hypothetical protein
MAVPQRFLHHRNAPRTNRVSRIATSSDCIERGARATMGQSTAGKKFSPARQGSDARAENFAGAANRRK